jgi:hypothetical protein
MSSKIMSELTREAREAREQQHAQPGSDNRAFFLDLNPEAVPVNPECVITKDDCYQAATLINESLVWSLTVEGGEFWQWVWARLRHYGNQP